MKTMMHIIYLDISLFSILNLYCMYLYNDSHAYMLYLCDWFVTHLVLYAVVHMIIDIYLFDVVGVGSLSLKIRLSYCLCINLKES